MKLWSDTIKNEEPIPQRNAMGKAASPATFSDNQSPHWAWEGAPDGTQSFALLCIDRDAPTSPEKVNKDGMTVPFDLPRADFVHWVLVDLPASTHVLSAGAFSKGVTAHGKPKDCPMGRHGLNDYTGWFAGDTDMEGQYFGYDGPFPPWNDERVHRYDFTLYALDVAALPVEGPFTALDVKAAMEGHILAEATVRGHYAIYGEARMPG